MLGAVAPMVKTLFSTIDKTIDNFKKSRGSLNAFMT